MCSHGLGNDESTQANVPLQWFLGDLATALYPLASLQITEPHSSPLVFCPSGSGIDDADTKPLTYLALCPQFPRFAADVTGRRDR